MKMKRKMFFVLLLSLILACMPAVAYASEVEAEKAVTGHIAVAGKKVTVTLEVAADTVATDGRLAVAYDKSKLTLDKDATTSGKLWEVEDLNKEYPVSEPVSGFDAIVSLVFADATDKGVSGTALTLVFEAADYGDVQLAVGVSLNNGGKAVEKTEAVLTGKIEKPEESTSGEDTPEESTSAESTPAESTPAESTPAGTDPAQPGGQTNTGDSSNLVVWLAILCVAVLVMGGVFIRMKKRSK